MTNDEKDMPKFKVGWVYQDGEKNKWLIISTESTPSFPNSMRAYPLNMCEFYYPRNFSLQGHYYSALRSKSILNLIHSTGRKWEAED